jgi:hypothetical protein
MRNGIFPTLQGYWSPITAAKRLKPGRTLALMLDGGPNCASAATQLRRIQSHPMEAA